MPEAPRPEASRSEFGVEREKELKRKAALEAAGRIADEAVRHVDQLERLLKEDKNLSDRAKISIENAIQGIYRAEEFAYGLTEETAQDRYGEADPNYEIQLVKRRRRELGLSDEE